MKQTHIKLGFAAMLMLAMASAFAGFPILSPDVLAGLAMLGVVGNVDLIEVKKIIDQQGEAWTEFKRTNDELIKAKADGRAVGDLEAKLAKIEKDGLSAGETMSAKLLAAENEVKAAKLAAEEAKTAIDELEAKLNRQGLGGLGQEKKHDVNQWARAVVDAHQKGVVNLTTEQQKALREVEAEYKSLSVAQDTTGGYLAPVEYVREIIKGVTEFSPMRSMVRVRQTTSKSIQLPKRTGQFAAQWVAEQGPRSETTGQTYGMEEIHAHEMYALIDISSQNLEDSAFDLEAEIREEAQMQFAVAEGAALVSGNGVGKPEGMLTNADVGITNSGAATAITADGILNLYYDIKTAYSNNGMYCMNRGSLKTVRTLKDGNGQYLWVPGLAGNVPNTINGAPYVECPDMPDQGANTFPVCFGDFRRGYALVDRIAMTMLRDPFTQATSGNIRFMFRRRLGGQVVLAEAMRKLKCAA